MHPSARQSVRSLGLALLVCCGCSAVLGAPADHGTLREGPPTSVAILGGEQHVFRLALDPRRQYRIVLVEDAIDLALKAGTDGAGEINAPLHGFGRETMLVAPAADGAATTISVRTVDAGASGAYTIELQRFAFGDARALAAARLTTDAGRAAAAAQDRSSRATAAERFGAAAQAWAVAGRADDRAHALHAQCELERRVSDRGAAIAHCEAAQRIWREQGDQRFDARVTTRLGLLYGEVGRSADAALSHRAALRAFESIGDRRGYATASVNLGLLLHYQGDLDGALDRYRAALAIYEPLDQRGAIANLFNNIGGIHYLRGEARAALDYFGRAVEMQRRLGDREGEASALGNLALLQRDLGDLQAALATQLTVLGIRRERDDREGEARALHNIGLIYMTIGEPDRARAFLADALQIRRATTDPVGEVATLRNLAQVTDELGDSAAALGYLAESARLAEAAQLRDAMAAARLVRGEVLLHAGERDGARVEFVAAAAAFRALGNRLKEAVAVLGEARILLAERALMQAGNAALAALATIADDHYLPLEAQAHLVIAEVAAAAGRIGEAERSVSTALARIESLRGRIGTPELRVAFAATSRDVYELAVALALQREPAAPTEGAAQALEIAERVRARTFNEMLGEPSLRKGRGGGGRAVALRARFEELIAEVNARDAAALEGRRPTDVARLRTELDAVEAELRVVDPAFADLRTIRPLSASRIRDELDADTTLLEYMVGERQSVLWVVSRGSLRAYRLPARRELEPLVRRVIDAWSRRVQGTDVGADATRLASLLLPRSALDRAPLRLAIVADGPLEYLPFAALPHAGGGRLIDRYEIIMLPSVTALATQRTVLAGRGAARHALALVADPVFDRSDPRAAPCPGAACAVTAMAGLPRLAGTGLEAQGILAIAATVDGYRAYGADATRQAIVDGALRDHRIVHLATHGVLDARLPLRTGLMFARVGVDGAPLDGLLGLRDVAALELDADLVVLSACDTALGREIRGEGLISLTRGFMHAGARRVLATLWRVSDRTSIEAMRRLYTALLRDGLPASAALRKAQLELARDSRWSDPYHWAAFTLHGDWRE